MQLKARITSSIYRYIYIAFFMGLMTLSGWTKNASAADYQYSTTVIAGQTVVNYDIAKQLNANGVTSPTHQISTSINFGVYMIIDLVVGKVTYQAPNNTISGTDHVTVQDNLGNTYTLTIYVLSTASSLLITTNQLNIPELGKSYSQQMVTVGGTGPYTYSLATGALPAGLSLSPSGLISGTPTAVGSSIFSIAVTDSAGVTLSKNYTLHVTAVIPGAKNLTASVQSGQTVTIDLTQGATGGPFLPGLPVLPVSPSNAGIATVSADNKMTFTAAANFTGTATIAYTLVNFGGVSLPSSVTITVNGVTQANPTQNATVMGIVSAQTLSVQQFASAQLSNFSQRLETLHGNGFGSSSFGLSFNQQLTPSEALAKDSASWQPKYDGDTVVKNAWQSGIQRVSWPEKSTNTDSSVTSTLPDLPNQSGVKQRALAFWISGVVDYGSQSANEQHGSYKLSTTGISLGVDYRWTNWLTIGTGLGYANSHADIGDEGSTNKSQSTMLMFYGSLRPYKHLYIDSIVGVGNLDFDMKRYDDSVNDFAHGSRGGNMAFGSVAVGWDFIYDNWLWSPYTRFDYSRATLDAYQETGAGTNNLYYYDQTVHTSKMNYGIRSEGKIDTRFGEWHPTVRIEYINQVSGSGQTRLSYADQLGTGPVYAVNNGDLSFGNWTVGLGSKLILRNHVELMLDYSHNINVSSGQYQSLRFTVRIPM